MAISRIIFSKFETGSYEGIDYPFECTFLPMLLAVLIERTHSGFVDQRAAAAKHFREKIFFVIKIVSHERSIDACLCRNVVQCCAVVALICKFLLGVIQNVPHRFLTPFFIGALGDRPLCGHSYSSLFASGIAAGHNALQYFLFWKEVCTEMGGLR